MKLHNRWRDRREDHRDYPCKAYLFSDDRVYERNHRGDLVSLGINLRLG